MTYTLTRRILATWLRWRESADRGAVAAWAALGAGEVAALERLTANLAALGPREAWQEGETAREVLIDDLLAGLTLPRALEGAFLRALGPRNWGEEWALRQALEGRRMDEETKPRLATDTPAQVAVIEEIRRMGYDPAEKLPHGTLATVAQTLGLKSPSATSAYARWRAQHCGPPSKRQRLREQIDAEGIDLARAMDAGERERLAATVETSPGTVQQYVAEFRREQGIDHGAYAPAPGRAPTGKPSRSRLPPSALAESADRLLDGIVLDWLAAQPFSETFRQAVLDLLEARLGRKIGGKDDARVYRRSAVRPNGHAAAGELPEGDRLDALAAPSRPHAVLPAPLPLGGRGSGGGRGSD